MNVTPKRRQPPNPPAIEPTACKHCGKRIVWVNWSWQPGWMHQPAGAAFQDDTYRYCRRTAAAPKEDR